MTAEMVKNKRKGGGVIILFEGRSKKRRVSFDHLSREMISDLAVTVSPQKIIWVKTQWTKNKDGTDFKLTVLLCFESI